MDSQAVTSIQATGLTVNDPQPIRLPYEYDPDKPLTVGGQAIIEGVMMRAPGAVAAAVRTPDGDILVRREPFVSLAERTLWGRIPILRGAAGLFEMLVLGMKFLNWSADVAEGKTITADNKPAKTDWGAVATIAFSLVLAVALFFAGPLLLTSWLFSLDQQAVTFNLVSGGFRVTLLLLYMWGISLIPDVFRLFQYHGAEHKSIFAFEEQRSVSLAMAKGFPTLHPRCGTSFLLVVMLTSILAFAVIDTLLIWWLGSLSLPVRLASHLPFIPVIAGMAYEIIKFTARNTGTEWGRFLTLPGLWLQYITTKEPDDSQLEVALVALRSALGMEPYDLKTDSEASYTRRYRMKAAA